MRASTRLRELIAADGIITAPGCYDGLSARLIENAGFPAVYVSGGATARSTGIPDMGLISPSEVASRLAQIVDAINIPVIAHGGAGTVAHIGAVVKEANASAVALGSMVVFQKKGMGVLVNFPDSFQLEEVLS